MSTLTTPLRRRHDAMAVTAEHLQVGLVVQASLRPVRAPQRDDVVYLKAKRPRVALLPALFDAGDHVLAGGPVKAPKGNQHALGVRQPAVRTHEARPLQRLLARRRPVVIRRPPVGACLRAVAHLPTRELPET